jgi:hypothetical protein
MTMRGDVPVELSDAIATVRRLFWYSPDFSFRGHVRASGTRRGYPFSSELATTCGESHPQLGSTPLTMLSGSDQTKARSAA